MRRVPVRTPCPFSHRWSQDIPPYVSKLKSGVIMSLMVMRDEKETQYGTE